MKIIIGAGATSYNGWLSTQEDELDLLNENDWVKLSNKGPIEALLSEHVWEHMTLEEGIEAAKYAYKYLNNGGYIRCAVPDVNFRNEWYQNMVQVGGPGPRDHPAYDHKIVYDYKTLIQVFESAGFQVDLLEYCDEAGNFHHKYWDEKEGMIGRSYRFDTRNKENELGMVSIIIDAYKV